MSKFGQAISAAVFMGLSIGCIAPAGAAAKPAPVTASKPGADPRECLKFSTNLEVAACAERYRPRPRR